MDNIVRMQEWDNELIKLATSHKAQFSKKFFKLQISQILIFFSKTTVISIILVSIDQE